MNPGVNILISHLIGNATLAAITLYNIERAYIKTMEASLKLLFDNLPVISFSGEGECKIRNICTDSRRVAPGTLFFAISGLHTDGNLYINEAINRGASAVVSEQLCRSHNEVVTIQVKNIKSILAAVARRFYHSPEEDIELVGITGTNGKTTVAFLVKFLLEEKDHKVGMIGTVQYYLGERTLPAYRTTPESIEIYSMLAQMRGANCREAVMEVSSHGIQQERVSGLQFKVAAFLGLTRDHIDYHKSMEEYFKIKCKLFNGETGCQPSTAVINIDDSYGSRLFENVHNDISVLSYGESESANIRATNIELSDHGSKFTLYWPDGSVDIFSPLLGRYNISNVLASMAIICALGRDPSTLASRLKKFPGVPGRMERIDLGQPFNVLVDYAHTDDALKNALSMLRTVTPGNLYVVFGCGGNRDREKRPLMTRAVMEHADYAWATSDNPRNEEQETIFDDMKGGVTDFERIQFIEDRRRAINLALESAQAGDCLLIAGKGHENFSNDT